MKKVFIALLGALIIIMALSLCASAEGDFKITSAASQAIGNSGAAVYTSGIPAGTEKIVFTVNGVDREPTLESPYALTIDYGTNVIYATAYDSNDEALAVSNSIEIYGNDYAPITTIKNYDFDELSASVTVRDYDSDPSDKASVKAEEINVGAPYNDVAWIKTENTNTEWHAARPEIHVTDYIWFRNAGGKNTYVYEVDVMPIRVDKEQSIGAFNYLNSAGAEKTINPITFTTDGKVKLISGINTTKAEAPSQLVFDAPANEWINFKILMDSVNEEILLVANDVVYSSFGFDSATSEANMFDFKKTADRCRLAIVIGSGGVGSNKALEFYIDNMKYAATNSTKRYSVTASTLTSEGETEGLDAFPLSGGAISLKFSQDMGDVTKEDFVFEVDGNAINFEVTYDASTNTAVITPLYSFIGRENCKISYDNLKTASGAAAERETSIEFTSDLPPCAISDCVTEGVSAGANADFKITVRNSLTESKDAMVLLGVYKDGGLESVATSAVDCLASLGGECELEIFIPHDYTESEYKIVAYLMYKNSFFIIDSLTY